MSALASLTLLNLAAAVLIRQQTLLNLLYALPAGKRPGRCGCAGHSNVHHAGGIHAGGALCGTAWLCAFASGGGRGQASATT